jgi:pimeloyl-ACP methyl ester carboxylesterase
MLTKIAIDSSDDPGLLKKHSTLEEYRTKSFTYPSIRTFYHPHPQAAQLPTKPSPLPLLVFIHGLGGSIAQFSPLLTSLINAAPCLAIDFPGCGLSAFRPDRIEAYTTGALASLVAEAIEQHRDISNNQKVVLVGHSLGCSIATLLASTSSPLFSEIGAEVIGLIAICPRAEPLTDQQISRLGLVRYVPTALFDAFRAFDRYGGSESSSVLRYVGKDADQETKRIQLKFNEQSKSAVFLNMLTGLKPHSSTSTQYAGLPGKDIWSGIRVPIFGIAGEDDHVSPPSNVELISQWLGDHTFSKIDKNDMHSGLPLAAGNIPLERNHRLDKSYQISHPQ